SVHLLVRNTIVTNDSSPSVDGAGKGPIARQGTGTWRIEGDEVPLRTAQKTVVHNPPRITVDVTSRDNPGIVDAVRKSPVSRTCARIHTGSVEGDDVSPRAAQKTVDHIVRVRVVSRNRACGIDALRESPKTRSCGRAGARNIEGDELAVPGSAQETVAHV